jgi:GTPase SAR1 family protein
MFGLENAGKTTFLYKLTIPKWKRDDIKQDIGMLKDKTKLPSEPMGRDPSYHYEEMSSSAVNMKYGMWEIPGGEVYTRMWPMFYRYVRMNAVFFVVDAYSSDWANVDKIMRARHWMNFLLNEDELRTAAFVLILNTGTLSKQQPKTHVLTHEHFSALERESHKDAIKDMTDQHRALYEMLGVPELMRIEAHKDRFFSFSCNCADFSIEEPNSRQTWDNCLRKIQEVYRTKGEGSFWGR